MEAKAGGLGGLDLGPHGLVPAARPPQLEFYYAPPKTKKDFMGQLGGIRSPLGLNSQDRTGQSTGLDKPDRTGQPTGTGSPPGLGLEAEASSAHYEESGALAGSLSNRFHFPTAPDESPWT